MQAFYIFSGLLICFALALLIYPLIKAASDNGFHAQSKQIKAELKSVAGLQAQSVLDDVAYDKSRRELADKLLRALEAPVKPGRTPMWIGAFFLSVLPLVVMGVYKFVGSPGGLSFGPAPLSAQQNNAVNANPANTVIAGDAQAGPAQSANAPGQGMDLKKAAEGLQARLAGTPDDGAGWELLGRTYFEIEDFKNAADALAKAIKLLPKNAELYAQYAEALMNAARPNMPPPEAEENLDKALAMEPNSQNALWLKGVCRKLNSDRKGALSAWTALSVLLPAGSESATTVAQQIDQLRSELGERQLNAEPAILAAEPNGENAQVAAVGNASVALEISISAALKSQLGPNDVLFVFAKAANGPPMPLAAHRSPAIELGGDTPMKITLTDSDAMMPTMKLSMFPQITLGARISKSGVANASSGDFQVLSEVMSQPVDGVVKLEISQVLP
jgi:cytochrome c-type biogenesis protein CcmH